MGRAANRYTNPDTGETHTTKAWCAALQITDTELKRRITKYGETGAVFVKKMPRKKRSDNWSELDRQFLKDCHNDPKWTLKKIAKKLEKSIADVQRELQALGLVNNAVRRPAINWLYVWRMKKEGLSNSSIARVMGVSLPAVAYALRKMNSMESDDRLVFFDNCGYL